MQRTYEVMFIIRPDLTDEDVDKLVANIEHSATNAGAQLEKSERMGKRRLAYQVRKFHDGLFVLFVLKADGKAIHEVERRLRVSEPVIKFITVRVDETQKRVNKIAKLRATRVKRSATEAPAATPEAAPSAPEASPAV